jgi:hypothetical protein
MMSDPGGLALIALLLPAVSFLILAVISPFRRSGRPAAFTSIIFAAGSLAAAIGAWRGHAEGQVTRLAWEWLPSNGHSIATIGVLADRDSTLMLILVALVAFLVQLYSIEYLHDEAPAALGRYYTYHSLFAFSMMGVVLAPNLLQLFICWELVGLCSFLLIGFWYQKPEAARAAVKAFWTTKAGDVGLLIGIILLWRVTGTFDLGELRTLVTSGTVPVEGLSLITFCIYLGAVGKSAQFPLHTWLPDAMEGPHAGLRSDPCRDDGDGGRVSASSHRVPVPAGCLDGRRLDRRVHGAARRSARVRAGRHQAGVGVLDGLAAWLHDGGDRRGVLSGRVLPPAHARALQSAALPRRWRCDSCRTQQ